MGKNSRRKRQRPQTQRPHEENDPNPKTAPTITVGLMVSGKKDDGPSSQTSLAKSSNPMQSMLNAFLDTIDAMERDHFFSEVHVEPERRAELWAQQAEIGEELVDKYSWAIPNKRSLSILKHFAPLVEVGCGANAYWCQQMKQAGIDIVGFDINPKSGGKIDSKSKGKGRSFSAQKGGPEVLAHSGNKHRNLFLCYPDENENNGEDPEEDFSLGLACLEHFQGDYVIHVGEIYGDTLSVDQAPWGRSSSPYFQQQLATQFHCVLQIPLPNWIHVRDTLTVWKRSSLCTIVFAADDEEEEGSSEEVSYRYVPPEERLPEERVAPFLLHLLQNEETSIKTEDQPHLTSEKKMGENAKDESAGASTPTSTKFKKKRKNSDANETKDTNDGDVKKKKKTSADKAKEKLGYECSW
eukprot:scaffold9279_cov159-Amphora_coffeaeformis.AAC.8